MRGKGITAGSCYDPVPDDKTLSCYDPVMIRQYHRRIVYEPTVLHLTVILTITAVRFKSTVIEPLGWIVLE